MRFEPGGGEGVPDPASGSAEEAQRVVGRELLFDAVDDLAVVPVVPAVPLVVDGLREPVRIQPVVIEHGGDGGLATPVPVHQRSYAAVGVQVLYARLRPSGCDGSSSGLVVQILPQGHRWRGRIGP